MAEENRHWGAPRIHGELLKLGFMISERTVARYLRHFNVTRSPTADWVLQQLREAFPGEGPHRDVIFDRDAAFSADVIEFLKSAGLKTKRTSVESPWPNGVAERFVGSCRRDILDHIIAPNEQHLRRVLGDYIAYYHQDRIHDSFAKDCPVQRPIEAKPTWNAKVLALPRMGGLLHRHHWSDKAA